jgi:hypothetical protein
MRKTIKQLFVGAVTFVLLCVAGCAPPRRGSEELAAQVLMSSRLHHIFAEAYAAGYRDSALKERKLEKEINCVETKITPEMVMALLTDVYSREFSDDELRQAISFFESEAGKAYLRYDLNLMREKTGRPVEQVPEFSPLEVKRINAFAETRVGKLILTPHSPVAEAAKEKIRPQIYAFFEQCKTAR